MKKRIIAVLLTCVLGASLLAGCGNKGGEGNSQTSADGSSTSAETAGGSDVFENTT